MGLIQSIAKLLKRRRPPREILETEVDTRDADYGEVPALALVYWRVRPGHWLLVRSICCTAQALPHVAGQLSVLNAADVRVVATIGFRPLRIATQPPEVVRN